MKSTPITLLLLLSLTLVSANAEQRPKSSQTQYLKTPAAPEKKPGLLNKLWPFGKEEKPATSLPKPEKKTSAAKPQQVTKSGKLAEPTPVSKPTKKEEAPGFFRGLFTKKAEKPKTEVEPKRSIVKTKTAEAMKTPLVSPKMLPQQASATPKEKEQAGFFSRFFGNNGAAQTPSEKPATSDKPLRTDDWMTKAIIQEQDVEAYSFGPSQMAPDARLAKGTYVKMKKRGKEWSEITLDDGRTLTVASDLVRMAANDDFRDPPPPPIAAMNPNLLNSSLPQFSLPMQDSLNLPTKDETSGGLAPESLLIPIPAKQ
jgi:hypothetical protein